MNKLETPIFVTKSFLPPFEEYTHKIKEIWDNNILTNLGPIHEEFKEKLNSYLKTNYTTLCTNGHLGLEMSIKALNLKGEVITTPFTFASTTHALVNCGIKPIFCDIETESYNIDPNKIENLINENTTAIMPVHVFGTPCNVEAIEKIAKKYNLKVLYDAAHCFGVEINGKGIGNFGDISMISLHATKVFNSIEGGALTYNDSKLKEALKLYKNFGITGPESVIAVGGNSKMNEFQAAMGIVNLRYMDKQIEDRKKITYLYRELLKDVDGIKTSKDIKNVKHNYAYFPILIDEKKFGKTRNELYEKLKDFNIFTRKYFYPLTSNFDCYQDEYKNLDLKNANYIADRILTLPIYGSLDLSTVEYIVNAIKIIKKEAIIE